MNDFANFSLNPRLQALALAERGIAIAAVDDNNRPLSPIGLRGASASTALIHDWFVKYPTASFVAPSGIAFGLLVVDVKAAHLDDIQSDYGYLPASWRVVRPGSNGLHLWFSAPEGASDLLPFAKGLDRRVQVRAWGAIPGTLHRKTGTLYAWAPNFSPDQCRLEPLPIRWLEALPRITRSTSSRRDMTPGGLHLVEMDEFSPRGSDTITAGFSSRA